MGGWLKVDEMPEVTIVNETPFKIHVRVTWSKTTLITVSPKITDPGKVVVNPRDLKGCNIKVEILRVAVD